MELNQYEQALALSVRIMPRFIAHARIQLVQMVKASRKILGSSE